MYELWSEEKQSEEKQFVGKVLSNDQIHTNYFQWLTKKIEKRINMKEIPVHPTILTPRPIVESGVCENHQGATSLWDVAQ